MTVPQANLPKGGIPKKQYDWVHPALFVLFRQTALPQAAIFMVSL